MCSWHVIVCRGGRREAFNLCLRIFTSCMDLRHLLKIKIPANGPDSNAKLYVYICMGHCSLLSFRGCCRTRSEVPDPRMLPGAAWLLPWLSVSMAMALRHPFSSATSTDAKSGLILGSQGRNKCRQLSLLMCRQEDAGHRDSWSSGCGMYEPGWEEVSPTCVSPQVFPLLCAEKASIWQAKHLTCKPRKAQRRLDGLCQGKDKGRGRTGPSSSGRGRDGTMLPHFVPLCRQK